MMELIENQVYLAQGAYAKVIGRSEGLLAVCEGLHYALVALHIRIQTAAAYAMLGKQTEARALLHAGAGRRRSRTALSCPLWRTTGAWRPCWRRSYGAI